MELETLQKALGYRFTRPALLRLALTHPSCGAENNQRLEFLGDAVLQLAMSDAVFFAHPQDEEGKLTFLRARMVREETLRDVAVRLELGKYLKMDHGCEQSGGRTRAAVLADAMEAVLAAVYLDGGFETARELVRALWPNEREVPVPVTDNKTALQELLQAQGQRAPEYKTLSEEGPAHARRFTVAVYAQGTEAGRGAGNSKKRAEQAAAGEALRRLRGAEERI